MSAPDRIIVVEGDYGDLASASLHTPDEGYTEEHGTEYVRADLYATALSLLVEQAELIGGMQVLLEIMIDNDPYDDTADGVSVLDVWRQRARATIARIDAIHEAEMP